MVRSSERAPPSSPGMARSASSPRSNQKYDIDPNDDESILNYFEARWKNKDYYKNFQEQQWLTNIARYEGFYYMEFKEAYKRFEDLKVPPWRVKLVSNLALPIVRTAVSKFVKNRPVWDVLPATENTEDIARANIQKKYLQAYWYKFGLNYDFVDLLLWIGLTGNGFEEVCWNPNIGPIHEVSPTDFLNQELIAQVRHEEELLALLDIAQNKYDTFVKHNLSPKLNLGETEHTIRSPFEVVFPFGNDFRKKPWYITGTIRSIDYYVDRGFDPQDFPSPSTSEMRYMYYNRRINNMNFWSKEQTVAAEQDDRDVLELSCWLPRSRRFPDGFWAVIAGHKVLSKGPIPYDHGEIPAVHYTAEKTPGKIWGFTSLSHALPLIEERQHTLSQLIEIKNMTAKPKILAPRSAQIGDQAWTSEPGEIVEYNGLQAPVPWTPPSPPRYVFELLNVLQKDIDGIVAQRDATKGINPAGVRSGSALVNLQDQDEGQLAIVGLLLDTGQSQCGRLILSTSAQYIDEERVYSFTGEKNRFSSVQVNGNALKGGGKVPGIDYYNVRVTQFSQWGLSRTGQLEFLKVLLQYGVYQPGDREKVLQFIQMGYFEDQLDEYKLDRSNAYQENLEMSAGMMVMPTIAEHYPTHKEEHEYYMKSDEFKHLDPKLQQLHTIHLRLTKELMYAQLSEPRVLGLKGLIQMATQNGLPWQLFVGAQNDGNAPAK